MSNFWWRNIWWSSTESKIVLSPYLVKLPLDAQFSHPRPPQPQKNTQRQRNRLVWSATIRRRPSGLFPNKLYSGTAIPSPVPRRRRRTVSPARTQTTEIENTRRHRRSSSVCGREASAGQRTCPGRSRRSLLERTLLAACTLILDSACSNMIKSITTKRKQWNVAVLQSRLTE
jgi:hypothetical protein